MVATDTRIGDIGKGVRNTLAPFLYFFLALFNLQFANHDWQPHTLKAARLGFMPQDNRLSGYCMSMWQNSVMLIWVGQILRRLRLLDDARRKRSIDGMVYAVHQIGMMRHYDVTITQESN